MNDTLNETEQNKYLILLQNFSSLRSAQDQVLWSICGAFWGTNALLLVSLFASDKTWTFDNIGKVLSCIGIFVCTIWILIQTRTLTRIEMYEASIRDIETGYLQLPKKIQCSTKNTSKIKIKARDAMVVSSWVPLLAWLAALIFFLS